MLLGPGAGDPEGGVQGDQRDREERQEYGHGHRDDADQRCDAEQGDRDEALAQQGGAGDGRQPAALGCPRIPQQDPGHQKVGGGGQEDFRDGGDAPVEWMPG